MPKVLGSAMTVTGILDVCKSWIEHVTFCNKEDCIAVCAYVSVHLYRFRNDSQEPKVECVSTMKHPDIVWKSAFAQDDLTLFSSCADGCIYTWDVNNNNLLYNIQVEPEKRSLLGIALSPDGRRAAVSSVLGNIFALCLENKKVLSNVHGHNESVEDICYSPSGKLLASCGKDGKINLWSDIEFHFRNARSCEGHIHWIYSCSFSSDETLFLSSSADKTIKLWSVARCECLKTFHGHKGIVWCAQFIDKEATNIVSCSSDGTVR